MYAPNNGGVIAVQDLRLRGVSSTSSLASDSDTGQVYSHRQAQNLPEISNTTTDSPFASLDQLTLVFSQLFDQGSNDLYGQIEQVLIHAAYDHCQKNQVHTADLLGISRNVLRTQLKRFGLLASTPKITNTRTPHDTFDRQGFSARSAATV
jgi:sigma-54-specific transcriptional regulator